MGGKKPPCNLERATLTMLTESASSPLLLPDLPAGLLRDKGDARDLFLQHGLPRRGSVAAERWKYTPLNKMAGMRLHLPHEDKAWKERVERTIASKQDEIARFPDAALLLFVDGKLQAHERTLATTPYAGLPRVTASEPLAALNVGSRCEAWRVVLNEDTPFLHVLFLATSSEEERLQPPSLPLLQTRLRIEAQSGSTSLCQTFCDSSACWNNDVIEIEVAEEARLEHVVLQERGRGSCAFSHTTVRVAEKASYAHISALKGEGLTRQEVSVALEGEEASCKLHGAYRIKGKGHIDNDTEIFHNRARCVSDALYKGVVEDAGRGVFHGKIFVAQDAQETRGYQMSRALLLSERAHAYHKPELEIYADDVICSHGSTVGALDEEQLLYLRSRGIVRARAEAILLEAFVNEALRCERKECAQALQAHMAR